ncbi:MAG TPA: type II toxin-antitoxin system VapC family toxin [Polyangiaceae bacterium]
MVADLIVLDTHALLWWALDPDQLSEVARSTVLDMEQRGGFASAISIWEIAIKVKRGKLELPISVEEFTRRIERGAVVELVPVDTSIWLRSVALAWKHADPADRVIVATALMRGLPILTKDTLIREFTEVKSLW